MTGEALDRRIDMTGWSTVALGAVCLALAGLQAVTPWLLSRLATVLESSDDASRAMREAWSTGAGGSSVVNGLFGLALIVVGLAVTRRARWAHPALEVAGWVSIAVLAVLAKPSLAPMFALAGQDTSFGTAMLVASVALVAAQVAAVLWFLRFWRRPEVRDAFR